MKPTIKGLAKALVEDLFSDLDDRNGFDTGGLPRDVLKEWKEAWVEKVADAMEKAVDQS